MGFIYLFTEYRNRFSKRGALSVENDHACRRTVFRGRKSNTLLPKQISSKEISKSAVLVLWSGCINPQLQSSVNQFFSQTFEQLFSKKKREKQSPNTKSLDFTLFLELK